MKSGFLYVLVHPSDPNLFKIGVTTCDPKKRLSEHNRNYKEYTGKIVEETGKNWQMKMCISVPDVYWAESVFWGATPFADFPYIYGIEIQKMSWEQVQVGLDAAKNAGIRPEPGPLPDYVYAYTASIKKRLEGRGITLLGHVQSIVSGKADFRCDNGHEWRTTPLAVGEGEGCPECGMGRQDPEEIRQKIKAGIVCLLTRRDKPGFIRIGVGSHTLELAEKENPWGDWEIHRYRNVEEVDLAESVIFDLLGEPPSLDGEPIRKDLDQAEDAFRNLIDAMREKIALRERAKVAVLKSVT